MLKKGPIPRRESEKSFKINANFQGILRRKSADTLGMSKMPQTEENLWSTLAKAMAGNEKAQKQMCNFALDPFQHDWNQIALKGLVYENETPLLVIVRSAAKNMVWAQTVLSILLEKEGVILNWAATGPQPRRNKNVLCWLVCCALKGLPYAQKMVINLAKQNYTLFPWQQVNEDKTRLLKWGFAQQSDDLEKMPTPFWGILQGSVMGLTFANEALEALLTQKPKDIVWTAKPSVGKHKEIIAFDLLITLLKQGKKSLFHLFFDCMPKALELERNGINIVHELIHLDLIQEATLLCLAYSPSKAQVSWRNHRVINHVNQSVHETQARLLRARSEAQEKCKAYLQTIQILSAQVGKIMPAEIVKGIGARVMVAMLKDAAPDIKRELLEKVVMHFVDFTQMSQPMFDSPSYQMMRTLAKRALVLNEKISPPMLAEKAQNVVEKAMDPLKSEPMPVIFRHPMRKAVCIELQAMTASPTPEEVTKIIQRAALI